MIKKLSLTLLFLAHLMLGGVRGGDSINVRHYASDVQFITERDFDLGAVSLHHLDTSLKYFHEYDPVFGKDRHRFHLGNMGTAHYSLLFEPLKKFGFDLGFHQFDLYTYQNEDVRYYNTKAPFSELHYILGAKEEQLLRVTHTQNLHPRLNLGFKYRRLASDGIYVRQRSDIHNLMVWQWYRSKSERYNVFINFVFNKLQIQENGGVLDDSLFYDTLVIRKDVAKVNLQNAENRWNKRQVHVRHSYDFGRYRIEQVDDTTSIKKFLPRSRISHSFSFENNFYAYIDQITNSSFYPTTFYNGERTRDSLHYYRYDNGLSFMTTGIRPYNVDSFVYRRYILQARLNYESFEIYQQPVDVTVIDTTLDNLSAEATITRNMAIKLFKFDHHISFRYGLTGFNEKDYRLTAFAGYHLGGSNYIRFGVDIQDRTPSWISHLYRSNHFDWTNAFVKEEIQNFSFGFQNDSSNFSLGARYYSIDNFVYWDVAATPKQTDVTGWSITLKKDFRWKILHLHNTLHFQQFDTDLISLPDIIGTHTFFISRDLFASAIYAQIGFVLHYNSNFNPYAYMPVTGQFHLQDEKRYTFYPVLDVFLNVKVKRAQLFLKSEHLNQGVFEKGYFSALHYPMPDQAIKFGVSWMFYD